MIQRPKYLIFNAISDKKAHFWWQKEIFIVNTAVVYTRYIWQWINHHFSCRGELIPLAEEAVSHTEGKIDFLHHVRLSPVLQVTIHPDRLRPPSGQIILPINNLDSPKMETGKSICWAEVAGLGVQRKIPILHLKTWTSLEAPPMLALKVNHTTGREENLITRGRLKDKVNSLTLLKLGLNYLVGS